MRKQKVKFFRRLVARNWARIDDCCGVDSFKQVCDECRVPVHVIYRTLNRLAIEFCNNRESIDFDLGGYAKTDVGGVEFDMKSRTTGEIVVVGLSPWTINIGKGWQEDVTESATQSESKK